jgi:prophage regulatory protein
MIATRKQPASLTTIETSLPTIQNDMCCEESLLRLPEVIKRTGLCKALVYRREGFPKPVKLGRSSVWIKSEVDAWIAEFIVEGRRQRAA